MARLILTLWFAVATLLGPGMCCCLMAAHNHAAPKAVAPPAAPQCPNCAKKQGKQAPAKAPKHDCPCKKDSRCPVAEKAVAQVPAPNQLKTLVDSFAALASLDVPVGAVCFAEIPAEGTFAWLPFLDTDDLLYRCHILRC